MIDLNSPRHYAAAWTSHMVGDIDAAIEALPKEERHRLGASTIGDECLRRVQLEFLGYPADPWPARIQRIFNRGHAWEDQAAGWLKSVPGMELSTEARPGVQHGFSILDGQAGGHADGIIKAAPAHWALAVPCLWEHKAVNHRSWKSFVDHGLRDFPRYDMQRNLYQHYLDLPNPCLFQMTNADTMETAFWRLEFNPALAQEGIDRFVTVIREGDNLLPRVSENPDAWPCSSCRFREACYGAEN